MMRSRNAIRLLALLLLCAAAEAATIRIQRGMRVAEALLQFRQSGVNLIFTSRIVTPEMRVDETPRPGDARAILEAILAPHALGLQEGPNGSLIVVRIKRPAAALQSARTDERELPPRPPLRITSEIVIESDALTQPADDEGVITLTSGEIDALPHIGDDVFRAVTLLPGATAADTTAEIQLRGARRDELLIRLDGRELYQPWHLRDFDNALSMVSAARIAEVNLVNAPPVIFGDRAAGALDMITRAPSTEPHLRLGLSLLDAEVQAANATRDGRHGWTVSLRRGMTDVIGNAVGGMAPNFSDLFAKFDYQPTPSQSLAFRELASLDELQFAEEHDDAKRLDTEYLSQYTWLSHRLLLSPRLYVDTTLSHTHISQERLGEESDSDRTLAVKDDRALAVSGVVQRWSLDAAAMHTLGFGFEYDLFRASYDYASERQFMTPLAILRSDGAGPGFALTDRFSQERISVYAFDRLRPATPLMIELGLRYDAYTADHDSRMNPRVSAAWSRGPSTFRAGWGAWSQSQRPYELMLEDHDPRFYPSEHSQQAVAGVEHIFASSPRFPFESLRVDVYRRTVANPRPRYRNLFDVFDPFPEGQADRVRIAPDSSTFQGIEVLLRGRGTRSVRWWINYALASARDSLSGRDVPRETDQRHTINADVNLNAGRAWNVNAVWTFRSGWPATPITMSAEGPLLGALNSERLPPYHRLDLRVSRDWSVAGGTLTLFIDGRNLYNHRNVAGRDVHLEAGALTADDEHWPGFIAVAGAIWRWR